jgi:hypothetical protein
MTKLVVPLTIALAAGAFAQSKPSANVPAAHSTHSAAAPKTLAQPNADAGATALPVGTAIRMRLETPVSTSGNKRGDHFGGRVVEAVMLNGKTIIPVGAALEGEVMNADEHRRIRGTPTLDLRPTAITLPDGQKYAINASIVDTSDRSLNVNDEGEIKGPGHDRSDWVETGVGAAVGTGIGAAAGGFKGALIGGSIGAGATVIHWLTKTKSAQVPAGTEIIMELSRPMAMSIVEGD